MMNPKYALVNKIEKELGIQLTNKQLEFIFNESQQLLAIGQRKSGKSLMTSIKIAVNSILNPNSTIGVFCPCLAQAKVVQTQIVDIFNLIAPNLVTSVRRVSSLEIVIDSNTVIKCFHTVNLDTNLRGHKFTECYLVDLLDNRMITRVIDRACMAMCHLQSYRINIIGTPGYRNEELDVILENYYEQIQI